MTSRRIATKAQESAPSSESLTHRFHPYAAKFHQSVPRALLLRYATPGMKVLDPFCGSGTTLVEALVFGCSAVGVDIHPLAVLVSRVKTTLLSSSQRKEIEQIAAWADQIGRTIEGSAELFDKKVNIDSLTMVIPEFDNRDHWFSNEAQRDLGILRGQIEAVQDGPAREFLWVGMSVVILRASRQDSETRYTAVDREYTPGSAVRAFAAKLRAMLSDADNFAQRVHPNTFCRVFNEDIRAQGKWFRKNYFDVVLTSPPYANSYDYYLYHKQRMNWLGLDFRIAKDKEIGSRLEFSSHKAPFSKFVTDMTEAFTNIAGALKPEGRAIIVQGDSRVAGVMHSGEDSIREISRRVGLDVEEVSSVSASEVTKIFNPAFAVKGKKEHVIVLRKGKKWSLPKTM